MKECSVYLPAPNPDKAIGESFPDWFVPKNALEGLFGVPKFHVQTANHSLYLMWMIPTSFITVNPEISFCWVSLNKTPVSVDWVFKYQYLNKESYMGYFDEGGMPVISFNDGRSELYITTLKSENVAEKDIIQKTRPHNFIKRDRRSGTLVTMEIQPQPQLDSSYFMGAHIEYQECPRVIEPTGRKRTRKRSRLEDWSDASYYYSDEVLG